MILEVALLHLRAGENEAFEQAFKEAQTIVSSMHGYVSHRLQRCLDVPDKYLLLVNWRQLEDHTIGFRQSTGYQEWRRLLHHFYDPFPTVEHYGPVFEGGACEDLVMSASPLAIPVEEYLRTAFRPDCDYVDGALIERNVGEKDHSKLQRELLLYLHQRRRGMGIFVSQEQRVRISERRYRVPDLCVVAGPEPEEQVFTHPPFLCVEILSPEDRMNRMQERIGDYLSFGVRCVWVLDPESRRAWIYTSDAIREVRDGFLRTESPEIAVPLHELFQ